MSNRALTLWLVDDDDPIALLRGPLHNDVDRAGELAARIYGDAVLVPVAATNLAAAMAASEVARDDSPTDGYAYVGAFGSATVVSSALFGNRQPSTMTKTVASVAPAKAAILLHTEPTEALGVFARWEDGELRRSFSANPIDIYEDSGLPFVFESPFWGGEYPLQYAQGVAPQPLALPFHPAQLAEQANREWLGFRFTPPAADGDVDPTRIPVTAFAIHPAGYQPTGEEQQRYVDSIGAAAPVAVPADVAPTDVASAEAASAAVTEPVEQDSVVTTAELSLEQNAEPVGAAPEKVGRVRRYFGFGPK